MLRRTGRLATLRLTALKGGAAVCEVLELPAKLCDDPAWYASVQNTRFQSFGSVVGSVEVGSVLSAAVPALLVRERRRAFPLTVVGASLLATALAAWLALVQPATGAA